MTDAGQIQAMIANLGPLDEAIMAIVQTEDNRWTIQFEHADVDIEADLAQDRLALTCVIGQPPEERRLAIYETLLVYSMLRGETGGIGMGLSSPGGDAVQMLDLPASTTTAQQLATVIRNLADRSLVWRAMFTKTPGDDAPAFEHTEFTLRA